MEVRVDNRWAYCILCGVLFDRNSHRDHAIERNHIRLLLSDDSTVSKYIFNCEKLSNIILEQYLNAQPRDKPLPAVKMQKLYNKWEKYEKSGYKRNPLLPKIDSCVCAENSTENSTEKQDNYVDQDIIKKIEEQYLCDKTDDGQTMKVYKDENQVLNEVLEKSLIEHIEILSLQEHIKDNYEQMLREKEKVKIEKVTESNDLEWYNISNDTDSDTDISSD